MLVRTCQKLKLMLVSYDHIVYPGGDMALASSLIQEIKERLRQTLGEDAVIELSHGRRAYCYRGEGASARAAEAFEQSALTSFSGVLELHPGTYCFVA